MTLIAFVGSVFSPYYALARRRGRGNPLDHCALNVALYGERRKYWAMTERPLESVSRGASDFVIGPSRVTWTGDTLVVAIDETTSPIPRRLKGMVRVYPSAMTSQQFQLDAAGRHIWHPIAPCSRVHVDFEQPAIRWIGAGYFDLNCGDRPLECDFREWQWSRATTAQGTVISYDASARMGGDTSLALRVGPSGSVEHIEPFARVVLPRTGWRMSRTARGDAQRPLTVQRTLEDAPFYARSQLKAEIHGEPVEMMHESLSLDRLQLPVVRAMLPFRMPRW